MVQLEEDDEFLDNLNPVTRRETAALGDSNMRNLKAGEILQLERKGYFRCDVPYLSPWKPIVLFAIPDGRQQASLNWLRTQRPVLTAAGSVSTVTIWCWWWWEKQFWAWIYCVILSMFVVSELTIAGHSPRASFLFWAVRLQKIKIIFVFFFSVMGWILSESVIIDASRDINYYTRTVFTTKGDCLPCKVLNF